MRSAPPCSALVLLCSGCPRLQGALLCSVCPGCPLLQGALLCLPWMPCCVVGLLSSVCPVSSASRFSSVWLGSALMPIPTRALCVRELGLGSFARDWGRYVGTSGYVATSGPEASGWRASRELAPWPACCPSHACLPSTRSLAPSHARMHMPTQVCIHMACVVVGLHCVLVRLH